MSDQVNDDLTERAHYIMAEFEGTDLETAIANNLKTGNLDVVRELVQDAEAEISRQEFHNNDMFSERDEW